MWAISTVRFNGLIERTTYISVLSSRQSLIDFLLKYAPYQYLDNMEFAYIKPDPTPLGEIAQIVKENSLKYFGELPNDYIGNKLHNPICGILKDGEEIAFDINKEMQMGLIHHGLESEYICFRIHCPTLGFEVPERRANYLQNGLLKQSMIDMNIEFATFDQSVYFDSLDSIGGDRTRIIFDCYEYPFIIGGALKENILRAAAYQGTRACEIHSEKYIVIDGGLSNSCLDYSVRVIKELVKNGVEWLKEASTRK
ncbi:MAG: hypothetical protein U0Z75_10140 [Deinococcaceae bacterium]